MAWESLESHRENLRLKERELQEREVQLTKKDDSVRSREDATVADSLGAIVAFMSAADTIRAWIRLIEGAKLWIQIIFYTFDLDIICTALEAAKKRGVKVTVIGDRGRTNQAKGTQALMSRLRSHKIETKIMDGVPLQEHYTAGAQPSSGFIQNRKGIVHSKFMLADRDLVMGSTNFTTSSQCNLETNCQIKLTDKGLEDVKRFYQAAFSEAENF